MAKVNGEYQTAREERLDELAWEFYKERRVVASNGDLEWLIERIAEVITDPREIYPETAFDEMRDQWKEEGAQEYRDTTPEDRAQHHNE